MMNQYMKTFENKTAIVTGASRGIGRAIAERLGSYGASVVVNYAANADKAADVVRVIAEAGGTAVAVQGDMSKLEDIVSLFDATEKAFGRPHIVVSAAAISVFKSHLEITTEDYERVFSVNVRGVMHVLQQAAKRIMDGGRIIQFSTGGTKMPLAGAGLYAASKAAGEQFALCLSRELGHRGITVNLVSPGVTRTDGLILSEAAIQHLLSQTPLGRLGEPADIAAAVAFLASEDGRWINGQNIQVNGGIL
jgi:3-oxoacyl-[acyl-carrier protein] reductase